MDTSPHPQPAGRSPLLSLAGLFLSYWRMILGAALVAILAGLAVGLLAPSRYMARTMLFVSQGDSDPRAQMLAAEMPMMLAGLSGSNPNVKLIGAILKSRSLGDSVAQRFGPVESVQIQNNSDGSIVIEVTDEDPRRAATVANAYPELINAFVARVGVERVQRKQALLQQQILRARGDLEESERALVRFQQGQGVPDVAEQARGTVDAALQLQQRIAEKEIEVSQLRRSATPENPQLRAAESELRAWRDQLRRLSVGGAGSRVLLPLKESPELRATTARLLRDYTKNEQVYISLTAALAQTQIDGNNQLPVVSVIDRAPVPEAPSGPGLVVVLALALVAGLLVGLGTALLAEHLRAARRGGSDGQVLAAWEQFKSDLRSTLPGRRRSHVPASG